jgi:hypothetical protein
LRRRILVDGEDLVASTVEHLCEQPADEPMADDEYAPAGHTLGAAQNACERLDHGGVSVVHGVGHRDPSVCKGTLGETAGPDRRLGELLAGRFVTGPALHARPARPVVHECDALTRRRRRDNLVAEHRSGELRPQLLDVGPAQSARADEDKRAGSLGLVHLRERRRPGRV